MVSILRYKNAKNMMENLLVTMSLILLTGVISFAQSVQGNSSSDSVMKYFGDGTIGSSTIKKVTPILVIDFENRSGYKTGMVGRVAADAIAVELLKSTDYDVIHRTDVDEKMIELNYSIPLTWDQQVKLATELKTRIVISGTIKNIQVYKKKDGTYAEATIDVDVLSTLTKSPVNGGNITQRSSVKVGYSGNPDVLVQEALTAGAYQLLQQIQSRKTAIGTVMTTTSEDGVYIKGGKAAGFTPGMQIMTVRNNTITGKMHIKSINDSIAIATIDDDSGIGPGDRAFSVFIPGQALPASTQGESVSPIVKSIPSNGNTNINMGTYNRNNTNSGYENNTRENTGIKLLALGLGGVLYTIIKSNNGKNSLENISIPQVTVVSDSATSYPDGANMVRWASLGSRVVCYIIYRNGIPIYVVDGSTTEYLDNAQQFAPGIAVKSNQWELIIDSILVDGPIKIPLHSLGETAEANKDNLYDNGTPVSGTDTFSITTHSFPLKSGESASYRITPVYREFRLPAISDPAGQPTEYQLIIGTSSPFSKAVTLLSPPKNITPNNGIYPGDAGLFSCDIVTGANDYVLQLSSLPDFSPGKTVLIKPNSSGGGDSMSANITIKYLTDNFTNSSQLYWRFGAKVAGQNVYQGLNDSNSSGYVFSDLRQFAMPATPPVLPNVRQPAREVNGFGIKLPGSESGRLSNDTGIYTGTSTRNGIIHRK
jgi:hypothetical protein